MLLLSGTLLGKQGSAKVDGLLQAILDRLGEFPSLTEKARCAGLIGSMVNDLRASRYQPPETGYFDVVRSTMQIFDRTHANAVNLQTRVDAAHVLGQMGDPRLMKENWVAIQAAKTWSDGIELDVKGFAIGQFLVTVEEYKRFVEAGGTIEERFWPPGSFDPGRMPDKWDDQLRYPNRPIVNVTWFEAMAYCCWQRGRLPSKSEWTLAAYGRSGRPYPWGYNGPSVLKANYDETRVGHPTPVGLFPDGGTPEGIQDLIGNVWEWTLELDADGRSRIALGGSWRSRYMHLPKSNSLRGSPSYRADDLGFRCVR